MTCCTCTCSCAKTTRTSSPFPTTSSPSSTPAPAPAPKPNDLQRTLLKDGGRIQTWALGNPSCPLLLVERPRRRPSELQEQLREWTSFDTTSVPAVADPMNEHSEPTYDHYNMYPIHPVLRNSKPQDSDRLEDKKSGWNLSKDNFQFTFSFEPPRMPPLRQAVEVSLPSFEILEAKSTKVTSSPKRLLRRRPLALRLQNLQLHDSSASEDRVLAAGLPLVSGHVKLPSDHMSGAEDCASQFGQQEIPQAQAATVSQTQLWLKRRPSSPRRQALPFDLTANGQDHSRSRIPLPSNVQYLLDQLDVTDKLRVYIQDAWPMFDEHILLPTLSFHVKSRVGSSSGSRRHDARSLATHDLTLVRRAVLALYSTYDQLLPLLHRYFQRHP